MAEVGKITGPSGSPESEDKKTAADAEKFAEARRRVAQVSAVDPDEQKKRKRQEEAEEEENLLNPPDEPTPSAQITPFMLTQQPKQLGLFDKEAGSYPTPLPSSTTPSTSSPSPYETSFTSPSTSSEEMSYPHSQEESQTSFPPHQPSSSSTQASPSPSRSEATTSTSHKGVEPEQSSRPLPDLEKKIQATQDTTGFFEQLKSKGTLLEGPQELPSHAVESLVEGGDISTPLSPLGVLDEKKSEKLDTALLEGGSVSSLPGGGPPLIPPPESISSLGPYARLSPQIQELFDKMVGVMTVMHLQGMTETSFTLTSPKFAASVFFGAQIIIKEFSTAPQALNVQLNGSMQAVALFQANTNSLMAAFQAGNYNFKINRLETNYVSEDRPLFHRKEGASDQQNKDQGDQSP